MVGAELCMCMYTLIPHHLFSLCLFFFSSYTHSPLLSVSVSASLSDLSTCLSVGLPDCLSVWLSLSLSLFLTCSESNRVLKSCCMEKVQEKCSSGTELCPTEWSCIVMNIR